MRNIEPITRLSRQLEELGALGERFVLSCEKIAIALTEINETYKRQAARQFPERTGEIRDAVLSRVPTEEDRLREAQGASSQPIGQWLSESLEDQETEEDIGVREREWLKRHPG